ncbi:Multifunctional conjugation protein TraI [Gemmata sp. SH-PL17]|uniref:MobF family relaxase n=1 Tax=Gemmata sp. SH-PL17 TaxID=1630693 RepID=UPI00078DECA7|nr:MobF family relaxase [Gemmata sp. SH-PL17]AMV24230.1 Multifunctional conjugation protein TraI [Gemmata sp. SH-PL17]
MLRIVPTRSAAQAQSYYSHSDYYAGDQEHPGVWRGKGAERLGLSGTVEKEQFAALCENRDPSSGERVTASTRANRTVGYDFNFHAPKSLSVLHALTGDPNLLRAFQESVDATMGLIEADAQTRVRKGYTYQDRTTGELVWARFDHLTARPIDGVPDPHLHSHCFVQNMTFDRAEGQWKAGQFRNLKRDAPFYQAVFHAELTSRLRALGILLDHTPEGWEVRGFDRTTLDKFSRRTKQIEQLATARGITDPDAKAELGAKTRRGKAEYLSMDELRALWSERLDPVERGALQPPLTPTKPEPETGLEPRAALAFACQHLFERRSVVSERELLAETLRAGLGRFNLADAERAVRDSDVLVRELDGRRLATTRAVLAEEEQLIAFARDGRGRCAPLGRGDAVPRRGWLNTGQKAAVRHVLSSPDRVMLIRGAAGTGKTTLMQEAVEAIERAGTRVFTFAPSADASRGVLRKEGFTGADTVARLLIDTTLQERVRGQVLWIDEAGLLGATAMRGVFTLADRLGCRVVLSGDRKQHGSVARGAVLKVLEEQAGLAVAEVKDVQRQKGAYKAAVELLSEGRAADGFDALDRLGWVKEVADADRYTQLAADYVAAVVSGKSALVVSPTHAEGAEATGAIRTALKAAGKLGTEEQTLATLTRVELTEAERTQANSYRPGDVLQFHQNAKGFTLGQRVVVEPGISIPLDQAARFQVFRPNELILAPGDRVRVTKGGKTKDGHKLENGGLFTVSGFTRAGNIRLDNGWIVDRDYGHLSHGYVATSHASQGKTVDRVMVAQSSRSGAAASREQFYVSASRARQQMTVYTDDKEVLREAIGHSADRLSATELVRSEVHREQLRLRARLVQLLNRFRGHRPQPTSLEPERREGRA